MVFTKIEPNIPFPQLLSKETVLPPLMNPTGHFVSIKINFIPSCPGLRDKRLSRVLTPTLCLNTLK